MKGWAKPCRPVWLVRFLPVKSVVRCGGGVSALYGLLCVLMGLFELDDFEVLSMWFGSCAKCCVCQCFLTSVTQSKWVSHQSNTAASHLPPPWIELVLYDGAIFPSFTSLLWCFEFRWICFWLIWNPNWTGEWGRFLPYGSLCCVCHFSFAVDQLLKIPA